MKMNEFLIVDLFKITSSVKKFNAVDVVFVEKGGYPYVARGSENNGIKGYIYEDTKYLNSGNTISFGQDTATMFYQENPYFTGDKIKIFTPLYKEFNKTTAQFILSSMRKAFVHFSWGGTSFNEKVLKEVKVSLPVKPDNSINWEYIEATIKQIETKGSDKVQKYLNKLGYSNIQDVEKIINAFNTKHSITDKHQDFYLEQLFNVAPSKGYPGFSDDEILSRKGKTPYISNQSQSNGLIGYSLLDARNEGNVITVSDTWESERTLFYQGKPFIGKSHLQVLKPKFEGFNKEVALYIISTIRRAIAGTYNYGIKFNRKTINSTKIRIPITDNGEINVAYMENYIKYIQALACKKLYEKYLKQTLTRCKSESFTTTE